MNDITYEWERAKSGKAKCKHCDFMGKPIPEGTLRLRCRTGFGPSTRGEYLCRTCGEQLLKTKINNLKRMLKAI